MPVVIVEIIGWLAAALSSIQSLPQAFRIARTASDAGVSMLLWQGGMASGSAWLVYGLLTGTQQIIWPNALWAATSAWIVWRLSRMRRRTLVADLCLPLAVSAVIVGSYFLIGAFGFGLLVAIPTVIGLAMQLLATLRAPDVSGISPTMLVLNSVCICCWLAFGFLIRDGAILGADIPICVLTLTNLVVLLARRAGWAARSGAAVH